MIGVPRLNYGDLRTAVCVTCDYSLAGLDPASKCPECGTAIAESLRAAPFPGMTRRDAARLAAACRLLLWAFFIPILFGILAIVLVVGIDIVGYSEILQRLLSIIMVTGGTMPLILWIAGWIGLARVTTEGAGARARGAMIAVSVVAWAQPVLLLTSPLWTVVNEMTATIGVVAAIAVPFWMASVGQWRLATLCRRSRDAGLADGGRDVFRLLMIVVAHVAAAVALVFIEPGVAALFGIIGAFLLFVGIIGWLAFLAAVRRAALQVQDGSMGDASGEPPGPEPARGDA